MNSIYFHVWITYNEFIIDESLNSYIFININIKSQLRTYVDFDNLKITIYLDFSYNIL